MTLGGLGGEISGISKRPGRLGHSEDWTLVEKKRKQFCPEGYQVGWKGEWTE